MGLKIRSGKSEGFPYSLSRWTDLPAAKWDWFKQRLKEGWMAGIDPTCGVPDKWSLLPEDTAGLVFWTRNSSNLLKDHRLVEGFPATVHYTLTGWHEVEHRAPDLQRGLSNLSDTVSLFGADNVVWRFSPIPDVPDALDRFKRIAEGVQRLGVTQSFVSFLHHNDLVPETRGLEERATLLRAMRDFAPGLVKLCNGNSLDLPTTAVERGVCDDGQKFGARRFDPACRCALMVDPFTQNEACVYGCRYCYAADVGTSPKKRNTTRLPMLP